MKELRQTAKFRRDFKKVERGAGKQTRANLAYALEALAGGGSLPPEYRDHALIGNWAGFRECHIGSDLLLIYETTPTTVFLARLGSHSELLKK